MKIQFIRLSQIAEDTLQLVKHLPEQCAGIVGIPRSGMMPASILASVCHLPLFELTDDGVREMGHGFRGYRTFGGDFPQMEGTYFVIDDSSHNGGSIEKARKKMGRNKAKFGVVYALKPETVDCYARILESPHLLEHNIWNNGLIPGMAQDQRLTGGICFDLDVVFDENWKPRVLPRMLNIPLMIASRGNMNSIQAELRKWDIRVDKLVCSSNKANIFNASRCCMMLVKDDAQAKLMGQRTKKPIICISSGMVYNDQIN